MISRSLLFSAVPLLACGCGLFINPEAHIDGGLDAGPLADTGMGRRDAGPSDAGPPLECNSDSECAVGAESCDLITCIDGRCVVSGQVDCSDGIPCTRDACDGAGGCVHEAEDAACPAVPGECLVAYCDPTLGCTTQPEHSLCDDGFDCTRDVCGLDGSCVRTPDDDLCPLNGSECDPDETDPNSTGCTEVECIGDDDCLAEGECIESSTCDLGVGQCVVRDRDGDDCTTTVACADRGICNGTACEPVGSNCPPANAPCYDSFCDVTNGACSERPRLNGAACRNATPCETAHCDVNQNCVSDPPSCVGDPATCETATCNTFGNTCEYTMNCLSNDLVCDGAGGCECAMDYVDCDGEPTNGCECFVGDGLECLGNGSCGSPPLDAGRPDGGATDAGPVCPSSDIADVDGYCGAAGGPASWREDCNNDDCCDCDRRTSFCAGGCRPNLQCNPACTAGQFCCPCSGVCATSTAQCAGCFPPGYVPPLIPS